MKLRMTKTPPYTVHWGVASSPAGKVAVGVTDDGEICRLSYVAGQSIKDVLQEWQDIWPKTSFVKDAKLDDFMTRPIRLVGTRFQNEVWRVIASIPAGTAISYGEVAKRIGNPKAVRAVGTACGANPVAYIIPCHRIVASNGLGGFGSSMDIKKKLLKIEGYL
jgi:O-6-methylguanine DNA methyltransferase